MCTLPPSQRLNTHSKPERDPLSNRLPEPELPPFTCITYRTPPYIYTYVKAFEVVLENFRPNVSQDLIVVKAEALHG
jgi:hypothetical protein